MEKLQGQIDSCFLDELLVEKCLQHGLFTRDNLRTEVEEEELQFSAADLEDQTPFLQMLQCDEEPNLHSILKIQTLEPESCLTHEAIDQEQLINIVSTSSSPPCINPEKNLQSTHFLKPSNGIVKEKRRRKRTKAPKNKQEVENQRMTHIAVERNRRRQMNGHLNTLKSLMPSSYFQRGDQASIIGGAIDFIKELEQLLQSIEPRKRIKIGNEKEEIEEIFSASACDSSLSSLSSNGLLFVKNEEHKVRVERNCESAEIEVMVMQNHVNLKVRCKRQQGQLLRAIVSLQELSLVVLHLNITSSQDLVFYSFSLKMEDECELGSADEVAAAAHQIFTVNGG